MIFSYEAVNSSGQLVTGELEGTSRAQVIRLLRDRQLKATDVAPVADDFRVSSGKKATREDLLVSLHEMVTLLESGVSIAETIEAQSLANYPDDLAKSYRRMAGEIRKGGSFSSALQLAGFNLPAYIYYLAEAGELTGTLADSLREGVEQFEYDLRIAQDFRTALTYPAILVFSGIVAVLLVFVLVVPKFLPMLERVEELPLLSEIVFTAGRFFNEHYLLVLGFFGAIAIALALAASSQLMRQRALDLLAGLPVVGVWIANTDTARWSSVMAAMLASRLEILAALDLASQAVKSSRRRARFEMVIKDIRAGEGLADSLEKAGVLTSTGYNLIRSGERTGRLPEMMRSLAKLYDEAARGRMKRVLALIEPLAILIIGSLIGSIILGVILAITSVNEVNF